MSDQATPVITPETVAPATNKRWYVVHAYSGMEKAVERNLRERIDRAGMQEKFGRILVPMEEGLRFAIREGGRTVGAGVVAKIIE